MSELPASEIENTPDTHLVMSLCANNLTWPLALGELIDNALDAGATVISIAFGTRKGVNTFSISDDGAGCEDPCVFVRLGGHRGQASTKLGRYGIGAKESVLWIGREPPRVEVVSTHGGKRRLLSYDWAQTIKTNRWPIPRSALTEFVAIPGDVGTTVRITSASLRRVPHGQDLDRLLATLGYLYAPAIKSGRRISVALDGSAPSPIAGFRLPALELGHVDQTIDVCGKKARVIVGIVPPGTPNPRPGITYTFGFRVVLEATGGGCGGFNHARIAGIVDLGDGWVLSKNKDNISKHREDLFAAVFACCRELLKRAEAASQRLESAALTNQVDRALNDTVFGPANAKAERGKGDTHGTKLPTGKGGKHTRAEREQDGATFARLTRGSLRVSLHEDEPGRLGQYSEPVVMLNPRHPFIEKIWREKNADAIVMAAISLLASKALTSDRQQVLKTVLRDSGAAPQERFERVLGQCLRGVSLDGKELTEPTTPAPTARA